MISVFDIFKIGIGPSSSHTMGPMQAAREFAERLARDGLLERAREVCVRLYGSLALTGRSHGTDSAVLAGLEGVDPSTADRAAVAAAVARIRAEKRLRLGGTREIPFDEEKHLLFLRGEFLPEHPNALRLAAFGASADLLREEEAYSVGGGFVVWKGAPPPAEGGAGIPDVPYPFRSAEELLSQCRAHGLEIFELVGANERAARSEAEVRAGLFEIWSAMRASIERGFREQGILPGPLKLRRRAPRLHRVLSEAPAARPLDAIDWVNAYALAVNEENAAGGRVVTAPTNGAAGIVPAVLQYYVRFEPGASEEGILRFLLTAGAIAILYKQAASISGAEVGCQGEVGVACSMAAAGLVAASNGTNEQAENAAEIGMEHNLGLTCDPVGGLVQIPCIERNAMAAVKAINAARLALRGDGSHKVSLDQVIAAMRQTGLDMATRYKETSLGGLAVNVPEC